MNISYEQVSQKGYDNKFPQSDLLEPFEKTVFTVPCLAVTANGITNVVLQTGIKDGATENKTKLANKAIVTETVTGNGNVTMFPIASVDGKITRWINQSFVLQLVKEGKLKNEHFSTRNELKTKTTKESTIEGADNVQRLSFDIELERTEGRALVIGALQIPTTSVFRGTQNTTQEKSISLQQIAPITSTKLESEKIIALESEIGRLKAMIAQLQNFSNRTTTDVTLLEDDEYLTEIKERSEKYLYTVLTKLYSTHSVKWLNYNFDTQSFEESYQHHDFEILDNNGNVLHYIDCKATPQQKRTFYLTTNEWNFFLDCIAKSKSYQIYRVFNLESSPDYIVIDDLRKWIETGKVVPYLPTTETIKGGRVCLTLV